MWKRTEERHIGPCIERLETRWCLASVGWDGPGQGAADLTYYIGNGPSYLDQTDVVDAFEYALSVWAESIDIEFTPTLVPNQRDSIDLEFGRIDGRTKRFSYPARST